MEILVVLLALAVIGLAAFMLGSGTLAWRRLRARRAVVNLKSGRAVDGILVRRAGSLLFLRQTVVYEPGAEPVSLDGEAVIDRADVDFIQAL